MPSPPSRRSKTTRANLAYSGTRRVPARAIRWSSFRRRCCDLNHQFLGVNNAIAAVQEIKDNKGKLGVFWHTQGSGKSYSMVFFSQKVLRSEPPIPWREQCHRRRPGDQRQQGQTWRILAHAGFRQELFDGLLFAEGVAI